MGQKDITEKRRSAVSTVILKSWQISLFKKESIRIISRMIQQKSGI